MNSEQLAEEVVNYRSTDLSPVSPKPIHFPQPSNIPLLDLQMAAAFGQAGLVPPLPAQTAETIPQEAQGVETMLDATGAVTNTQSFIKNGSLSPGQAVGTEMTVETTDTAMTADSDEKAQAEVQIDTPNMSTPMPSAVQPDPSASTQASHDAAMAFLQSLSIPFPSVDSAPSNEAPSQHDITTYGAPTPLHQTKPSDAPADVTMSSQQSGGVNFDALLDKLSVPTAEIAVQGTTYQAEPAQQANASSGTHQTPIHLIPTVASLPPRPNVQQVGADVRPSSSHQQQEHGRSRRSASFSVHSAVPNGLSASLNGNPQHTAMIPAAAANAEDQPFSPELQKMYDEFLATEAKYMVANEWDKFPPGSRLFVGNLPSEVVSKPDVFRVFHKHGKLGQISIKQAYGFVQYLDADSCTRALNSEEGTQIRGRKIHLEVSKAQSKQNRNTDNNRRNNVQRRSRSPDYNRGNDRYRNDNNRGQNRGHDGYRPGMRSPTPDRGYRIRSDKYDGRRSRSPVGSGDRFRSPEQRSGLDDDCPLPRRRPEAVPDIQIISQDPPERTFIQYIERTFEARGIKVDVLILSPRLGEAGVIRRQIIEGVHAVMKLEKPVQYSNKFPLSIFDRSTPTNVRFEEYQDLDLPIVVELVARAKQNAERAKAQQQQYNPVTASAYPYSMPQQPPMPPLPPQQHNQVVPPPPQFQQGNYQPSRGPPPPIPGMPPNLDPASLQRLLGQLPGQTPAPYGQPPAPADLARMLAAAGTPQQHQQYPPPPQPQYGMPPPPPHMMQQHQQQIQQHQQQQTQQHQQHIQQQQQHIQQHQQMQPPTPTGNSAYQNLLSNPAIAALLGGGQQQQPQQQTPQQGQYQPQQPQMGAAGAANGGGNMQDIMAQLARYGR